MKVIASTGREDVATVYIAEMAGERLIEFVESVQPPIPRQKKWVLLVSTMYGCPVGCMMCDAGGYYQGKPTKDEILEQIDFLVYKRYPDGHVPSEQFKIQFARMGEPSLNLNVIDVLEELPYRYNAQGLMPSISTVAPKGTDVFFDRLLEVKNKEYADGSFQFQFSIHTTDLKLRDQLIPVKKWSFAKMAEYGDRFHSPGDRKITLNFALVNDKPVDPNVLLKYFTPDKFLIKITPLNPTYRAAENELETYIDPSHEKGRYDIVDELRLAGYQVILAIGEVEENNIGSNCGQYVKRHLVSHEQIANGYTYCVEDYT